MAHWLCSKFENNVAQKMQSVSDEQHGICYMELFVLFLIVANTKNFPTEAIAISFVLAVNN